MFRVTRKQLSNVLFVVGLSLWSVKALAQGALPAETDAFLRGAIKPVAATKIILVGDSTTAVNGGWGPSFCGYHVRSNVACVNLARPGRSSFSYRAEGGWATALGEIKAAGYEETYVLIQFGHNDQPGKPGRTTDLQTEFPAILKQYIEEARAVGAIPVLVTPLTRRRIKNGKLESSLAPWAEAVRKLALDKHVPLIDLYARSQSAVLEMGPLQSLQLANGVPSAEDIAEAEADAKSFGTKVSPVSSGESRNDAQVLAANESSGPAKSSFDYTHLGRHGADVFSAIVTDELMNAVPELRAVLIP